jgi:hypothetical protein
VSRGTTNQRVRMMGAWGEGEHGHTIFRRVDLPPHTWTFMSLTTWSQVSMLKCPSKCVVTPMSSDIVHPSFIWSKRWGCRQLHDLLSSASLKLRWFLVDELVIIGDANSSSLMNHGLHLATVVVHSFSSSFNELWVESSFAQSNRSTVNALISLWCEFISWLTQIEFESFSIGVSPKIISIHYSSFSSITKLNFMSNLIKEGILT